jgi:hypothetical protein
VFFQWTRDHHFSLVSAVFAFANLFKCFLRHRITSYERWLREVWEAGPSVNPIIV